MAIHTKLFQDHVNAVEFARPEEISQIDLLAQLGVSIETLKSLELPPAPTKENIVVNSEGDLTNLILRGAGPHERRERIQESLQALVKSASDSNANKARIHRMHYSFLPDISQLAEQDINRISLRSFIDSEIGRNAFKRWVKAALEQHPDNPKAYQEKLEQGMAQTLSNQFEAYLDGELPVVQGQAPELSEKEALLLAREYCRAWIAQSGKKSLATIHNPDVQLLQVMINGIRHNRWELPPIEGILTHEYWQQAINNDFKTSGNDQSDHNDLRDRCSLSKVLLAYARATKWANSETQRNINVHYLNSGSESQDEFSISDLTKPGENSIAVIDGTDGPVIAFKHRDSMGDYLAVSRPDSTHQVVCTSSMNGSPEKVMEALCESAAQLPPYLPGRRISEALEQIKLDWLSAPLNNSEALKNSLKAAQEKLKSVAMSVSAPGVGGDYDKLHRQEIAKLSCLLSASTSFYHDPLTFSPGRQIGTIATSSPPEAELSIHDNGDGTCDVAFLKVSNGSKDKDPMNGHQVVSQNKNIDNSNAYSEAVRLAKDSGIRSFGESYIGKPGLMVFAPDSSGKTVCVGNWLSESERSSLTQHSAYKMLFDPKHNLMSGVPGRTPEAMYELRESIIGALHGDTATSEELGDYIDEFEFSGDLIISDDYALGDSPACINLPNFLLEFAEEKEIKVMLAQNIALAGLPEPEAATRINTILAADWAEAAEKTRAILCQGNTLN